MRLARKQSGYNTYQQEQIACIGNGNAIRVETNTQRHPLSVAVVTRLEQTVSADVSDIVHRHHKLVSSLSVSA